MSNPRLMIPGPVEADDDVLAAISEQTLPHYGPQWMTVFNETAALLRRLFETEGDVLMLPGPGTSGVEAGISSLVPRTDGICVIENGFFGHRLVEIAEACGIRPWVSSVPEGQPADPDLLRRQLAEWAPRARSEGQPLRALVVCHHETGTGVLNPVAELAAVAREFDLAVIVDAVASFGGVRLPVDEWGIDVCVSVPNKCLAVPPGLALMSVSRRAWELAEANPDRHGWYLDLCTWRWYIENWGDWHPYPTTQPTNNFVALRRGLQKVFEEGVEAHFAGFSRAAQRVREGLGELGFSLFPPPDYAAPVISALNARPDFDIGEMLVYLRDDRGLMISGGLGALKGKIFRVGHMGRGKDPAVVEELIAAVHAFVRTKIPA